MRTRIAFALACTAIVFSALGRAAAAGPVATLGLGDAAFWGPGAGADGPDGIEFPIRLLEPGALLRVAVDRPGGAFDIEVVSPTGAVTRSDNAWWSAEAYVDDPQAGDWVVRVPASPNDRSYRMRARLEDASPAPPSEPEAVLPNLRMIPPFQLTFFPPAFGGVGGVTPNCSVQEIVETAARRCLRFSLGPANVGTGPLEVRFAALEGLVLPGTAYQRIFKTDGTFTERAAGAFEYHKTHMHYHHSGFGRLELLKVTDPAAGAMSPAGSGPKQGFCTGDVMMATWTTFTQSRARAASECVTQAASTGTNNPTGTTMGLTPGWADLYSWSQDGNYVEWGTNGDGLYVLRAAADSNGWILESDETDNVSYAYIRVAGEQITVLERGYGTDPWDPDRSPPDDILR